ncbi:hypothetical protein [Lacticaseibacillus rhamnosus]|uniref:hypothetical protein n=1 Tax=Lacticaseibacillus rhamnosus TaxID=47715 RepID=UPI001951ABA8|nr:hypothetical protein [Lacticaseibacillus rhamnosus]
MIAIIFGLIRGFSTILLLDVIFGLLLLLLIFVLFVIPPLAFNVVGDDLSVVLLALQAGKRA